MRRNSTPYDSGGSVGGREECGREPLYQALCEVAAVDEAERALEVPGHRRQVDPFPLHRRNPKRAPGHQRRNGMAGAVERRDDIGRESRDREHQEKDFDDAQINLSGAERNAATSPALSL